MSLHRKDRALGAAVRIFGDALPLGCRVTAGMMHSELGLVPGAGLLQWPIKTKIFLQSAKA
jgi:hypothetical protein